MKLWNCTKFKIVAKKFSILCTFKSSPDRGRVAALRPISLSAWQVKLAKYFSFIVSMERMRRFSRPSNNSSSSVDRRRIGPWNQISWKRKSSRQSTGNAWGPGTRSAEKERDLVSRRTTHGNLEPHQFKRKSSRQSTGNALGPGTRSAEKERVLVSRLATHWALEPDQLKRKEFSSVDWQLIAKGPWNQISW